MDENEHQGSSDDRRRFTRINFQGKCQLKFESEEFEAELFDISLKGILVSCPDGFDKNIGDIGDVNIVISENSIEVAMSVKVAHISSGGIGLKCRHIDIDSISHLKRLVELNLGVEALLQRELENLIADNN